MNSVYSNRNIFYQHVFTITIHFKHLHFEKKIHQKYFKQMLFLFLLFIHQRILKKKNHL